MGRDGPRGSSLLPYLPVIVSPFNPFSNFQPMEKPVRVECRDVRTPAGRDDLWRLGQCRQTVLADQFCFIFPYCHQPDIKKYNCCIAKLGYIL